MKLPGVSEAPKLAAHANGLHPRMPPEKASKIKPTVVLLSPCVLIHSMKFLTMVRTFVSLPFKEEANDTSG